MKPEWIRGSFRGVYAGERPRVVEGARRVPLDLEYGELGDVEFTAAPAEAPEADELHFDKVRNVRIQASGAGPTEGERTLFDVRIRDWRLLHPAESQQRMFGTLVGVLCARLLPEPTEPEPLVFPVVPGAAPVAAPEPAPASTAAPVERNAAVAAPIPEPFVPRHDETTPDGDLERLLWLVVPVLLGSVGALIASGCGSELAAIWLAPLVVAIAIRQTPERYRIHGKLARRWFGGLCVLAPIFALLSPLRVELALLGIPIAAAALIRTQIFLWLGAVVWTAIVVGWYAQLN